MKKIATLLLVLSFSVALVLPAFAVHSEPVIDVSTEESVARVEETKWYYRVYNGQDQKRLWSITYMKWLTAWMPYDTPYP